MKKKFRFLLLPAMVALSFLYYAFWTATFPIVPQSNNSVKVAPGNLGPLSSTPLQGHAQVPYWKIFFSLGDGRFWMGTEDNKPTAFSIQDFYYNTGILPDATQRNSFVEYFAAYDDDINPLRISTPFMSPGGTGTIPTGKELRVTMSPNQVAMMQTNRELCPGDIVSFILTRQYPTSVTAGFNYTQAKGEFTYDADVLVYVDMDHFGNAVTPLPPVISASGSSNSKGTINFNYNTLLSGRPSPFDQQNIFLNFRVNSTVTPATALDVPKFVIKCPFADIQGNTIDSMVGRYELNDLRIVNFHDPNRKESLTNLTISSIQDGATPYIDYFVEFQNEGDTSTPSVSVEEKLDALLDYSYPPVVSNVSTNVTTPPTVSVLSAQNRSYKIDFGDLRLRGLREPGLGTEFPEDSTKVKFNIRFKALPILEKWPTSVICNQAKVKFGCNPYYSTNIAKTIIPCHDDAILKGDTIIALNPPPNSSFQIGDFTQYLINKGFDLSTNSSIKFKWYPATGMNDPFIQNPVFNANVSGTYLLTVSECDPINRRLFVQVNIASPLKITVDKCTDATKLIATVSGYNGTNPSADLEWNDCSKTGYTHSLPNLGSQTTYYFGVTDLSTGNYVEVFYKLDSRPCYSPFNWVYANATLILFVIAGAILVAALRYFLRKQ